MYIHCKYLKKVFYFFHLSTMANFLCPQAGCCGEVWLYYISSNSRIFCRIEISSESRLKKLRDTEDETIVTGKKFSQKLKRQ